MPLHGRTRARYSISDAASVIGISERSPGDMVVDGDAEVERVGSSGGIKCNIIPVGEIPRVRERIREQQQAAETRRVAEQIAEDREEARAQYDRLQRNADALAERYGFED